MQLRANASGRNPSLADQLRLAAGLLAGLPGFLRTPLTLEDCRAAVERGLARREENLLAVLRHGVFGCESSPYRRLLDHAGIGRDAITELVMRNGVEGALGALHAAGVYVRLDEFKGRAPIVRGSLRLEVGSRDFDNPLAGRHLEGSTGGSRSTGTRIHLDLALVSDNALCDPILLAAHGVLDRPFLVWWPPPPYIAGINSVLNQAKTGRRVDRWFAQTPAPTFGRGWRHGWLLRAMLAVSRAQGRPLAAPEHVPVSEAWRVAARLAELKEAGRPACLNTNVSCGVRVCLAAADRGLDIAGTFFRVGGEPLTEAKARIFRDAGCRAVTNYSMGESGRIGIACARPDALDDMHVMTDRIAVLQRPRSAATDGAAPSINLYTTLSANAPKLMLNVESDDYGVLARRRCGCPIDALGLDLHLHTLRSYEKLTSEGMTFIGHDLIRLVEEVLPARFGGGPTDYQLVEGESAQGLPEVRLRIAPGVGPVDAAAARDTVIGFLNGVPNAATALGERWREAETLRIERSAPYTTSASKVMALHVLKPGDERPLNPADAPREASGSRAARRPSA